MLTVNVCKTRKSADGMTNKSYNMITVDEIARSVALLPATRKLNSRSRIEDFQGGSLRSSFLDHTAGVYGDDQKRAVTITTQKRRTGHNGFSSGQGNGQEAPPSPLAFG